MNDAELLRDMQKHPELYTDDTLFEKRIKSNYSQLVKFKNDSMSWKKFYLGRISAIFKLLEYYNIYYYELSGFDMYKNWDPLDLISLPPERIYKIGYENTKDAKIKKMFEQKMKSAITDRISLAKFYLENGITEKFMLMDPKTKFLAAFLMRLPNIENFLPNHYYQPFVDLYYGKPVSQSKLDDMLIEFAILGHLPGIIYMLNRGAHLHAKNDLPLIKAVQYGHLEIVKYLLNLGANIHTGNDYPLVEASGNGHLEIVKYLVEHGVDAQNPDALRFAEQGGYDDVVKYLSQYSGINSAMKASEKDILKRLFASNPQVEQIPNPAFQEPTPEKMEDPVAVALHYWKEKDMDNFNKIEPEVRFFALVLLDDKDSVMKYFPQNIKLFENFKNDPNLVLLRASYLNSLWGVQFAIDKGADPKSNYHVLQNAISHGNFNMVKLLVENGADPAWGFLPDIKTTTQKQPKIYNYLKSALPTDDQKSYKSKGPEDDDPISKAIYYIETGDNEKLKTIPADFQFLAAFLLGQKDAQKYVPGAKYTHVFNEILNGKKLPQETLDIILGDFASYGNIRGIKYMMSLGGNITANNNQALKRAVAGKHSKVVQFLVENGADPKVGYDSTKDIPGISDIINYLYYKMREIKNYDPISEAIQYLEANDMDNFNKMEDEVRFLALYLQGEYDTIRNKLPDYIKIMKEIKSNPDYLLYRSSYYNNLRGIKYAVSQGAKVNSDITVLENTIIHKNLEAVKYLIENGADPKTGLKYAENSVDKSKVIIHYLKSKVEQMTNDNFQAPKVDDLVADAIKYWKDGDMNSFNKRANMVKYLALYLLDEKAYIRKNFSNLPVTSDDMTLLEILNKTPDSQEFLNSMLYYYTYFGNIDGIKYMTKKGADLTKMPPFHKALINAIIKGDYDTIKYLVENGESVEYGYDYIKKYYNGGGKYIYVPNSTQIINYLKPKGQSGWSTSQTPAKPPMNQQLEEREDPNIISEAIDYWKNGDLTNFEKISSGSKFLALLLLGDKNAEKYITDEMKPFLDILYGKQVSQETLNKLLHKFATRNSLRGVKFAFQKGADSPKNYSPPFIDSIKYSFTNLVRYFLSIGADSTLGLNYIKQNKLDSTSPIARMLQESVSNKSTSSVKQPAPKGANPPSKILNVFDVNSLVAPQPNPAALVIEPTQIKYRGIKHRGTIDNPIKLGEGWNGIVQCCDTADNQKVVVKYSKRTANNQVDNDNLLIEYTVFEQLYKYFNFPLVPIIDRGENYEFLIRPYVDPNFFGDKVKFTDAMIERLTDIWVQANRYAVITGIPLDLSPSNLWWNGKTWLLVDTGPRLDKGDTHKFAYTLDPESPQEYYETYFVKRGSESALTPKVTLRFYPNHITMNIGNGIHYDKNSLHNVNIDTYVEEHVLSGKDTRIYLKATYPTLPIIEYARTDLQLSKLLCSMYKLCSLEPSFQEFSTEVNTIIQLRNDTEKFHDSLTDSEKRAFSYYTGSGYVPMNRCLRENVTLDKCPDKTNIALMENVLRMPNAPKLQNNILVFRGIQPSSGEDFANKIKNMAVGDLFEERAFVSTSVQHPPSGFVGNDCCLLMIKLPKGTPAYYIGKDSSVSHEEEVILLPGTNFRLVDKKTTNFKGRKVNLYIFECASCLNDKRYLLTKSPFYDQYTNIKQLPYQPTDKVVGKNRLGLYDFQEYNKYIPDTYAGIYRIMSWNVHEYRNAKGVKTVKDMDLIVYELRPDIISSQESTDVNSKNGCKADMGNHGPLYNSSIIKTKERLTSPSLGLPRSLGPRDRCAYLLEVKIPQQINIINVHLEVKSEADRLENVRRLLEMIRYPETTVIVGDFNSYKRADYDEDNYERLENIKKPVMGNMNIFGTIQAMEDAGYVDVYQIRADKLGVKLTDIIPVNTTDKAGRIDFAFVHKTFKYEIEGIYTYYTDASDHIPVIVDIKIDPNAQPIPAGQALAVNSPAVNKLSENQTKLNDLFIENVENGDLAKVRELVARGADIHYRDDFVSQIAGQSGDLEMVKYLFENGVNDEKNIGSIILYAIENGHLNIVKYLVENGANIKGGFGGSALFSAIKNGYLDIVKYLVENGVNMKLKYDKALKKAKKYGEKEIVKYLESIGQKTSNLNQQLIEASAKGDLIKVKEMLRKGANIHINGDNPLLASSSGGHLDVVKYLVEHKADIHAGNDSALIVAAQNGHLNLVKYLVEHGANIKVGNNYPLLLAQKYGHTEVVKYLESIKKKDLNITLIASVIKGDLNEVKKLVERGADIHYKDDMALTSASRRGYLEIVKYLTEKGIVGKQSLFKPNNIAVALSEASRHGHLDIVKYFVENGVNIKSFIGDIALEAAIRGNRLGIVQYLITQNINFLKNDKYIRLANKYGYNLIEKYLIEIREQYYRD